MFGVSLPELIVILLVALVVFGPERLPEIASKLGRFMGELRRNSDALRREFYNSVYKPLDQDNLHLRQTALDLKTIGGNLKEELLPNPLCPDSDPNNAADTSNSGCQGSAIIEPEIDQSNSQNASEQASSDRIKKT